MSNDLFYLVDYDGESCGQSEFISGEFNHDDWEWDEFDKGAGKIVIHKKYKFNILDASISSIEIDFLGFPHNIVSARFLKVCDSLKVAYRAVPVKVSMKKRGFLDEYYIFIPLDFVSLLEQNGSEYELESDLSTGGGVFNRYHPSVPVYSWIKQFATRQDVREDFFVCIELMKWVCSEKFKVFAENSLVGLKFTPIDSHFYFDPWGEMI